jgi:PAS domain S-box-containing protein
LNSHSKADFNLQLLRNRLLPKQDEYREEGYEAVAIHSSSILVCANQAAAEMFGYKPDEMAGINTWVLFKPEYSKTIMQHLIDKSEEPYQVRAIAKDKNEFDVELKGRDFEIAGIPVRAVLLKKL